MSFAWTEDTNDKVQWHKKATLPVLCAPGPASYTLPPVLGPNTVVTPAALAYSISGRNKSDSDLNKVCYILKSAMMKIMSLSNICCQIPHKSPGLVYKVVDPSIYRPKAPQYSMIGRNFPPDDSTRKPGPGAHYPEKVLIMLELCKEAKFMHFVHFCYISCLYSQVTLSKSKAPSFTFGIRHSQYVSSIVVDEFNRWMRQGCYVMGKYWAYLHIYIYISPFGNITH